MSNNYWCYHSGPAVAPSAPIGERERTHEIQKELRIRAYLEACPLVPPEPPAFWRANCDATPPWLTVRIAYENFIGDVRRIRATGATDQVKEKQIANSLAMFNRISASLLRECESKIQIMDRAGRFTDDELFTHIDETEEYVEKMKALAEYQSLPPAPDGHIWVLNPLSEAETPDLRTWRRFTLYDLGYTASGMCAPRAEPSCSYT